MNLRCLMMTMLLTFAASEMWAAESAEATFARAAQLADTDLTQSREWYRVAALEFLAEAGTNAAARGPLLYNAGNAFFLAGDAGQAVLAYRRAEPLLPGSAWLRDNLAFVRRQSGNAEPAASSVRFAALRFWDWRPAILWLLLAGAALAFWAELFRRQWIGGRGVRGWPAGTLALAGLLAGALSFNALHNAGRCRGVLVSSQVTARKGPNYGYAPAFTVPLDAGLECDVLGRQGDWLHVRLDDQRECWVRSAVVEIWRGAVAPSAPAR